MKIWARALQEDGNLNVFGYITVDALRKNGNRYQARLAKSSDNIPIFTNPNALKQLEDDGIRHWFTFKKSNYINLRLRIPTLNEMEVIEVDELQSTHFRKHKF